MVRVNMFLKNETIHSRLFSCRPNCHLILLSINSSDESPGLDHSVSVVSLIVSMQEHSHPDVLHKSLYLLCG